MYDSEDPKKDLDRPVVFVRRQSNEVLSKQIKALTFHGCVLLFWLVSAHLLVDMFLYLGAFMWLAGAITAKVMPNERENVIRNTHRFVLGYSSLVGAKVFILFFTNIPISEWNRALGVSVDEAFSMTAVNYLNTMFSILSIGIPVAFVVYIGSALFLFRSSVDVQERTRQITRTGEQRLRSDRETARKRI